MDVFSRQFGFYCNQRSLCFSLTVSDRNKKVELCETLNKYRVLVDQLFCAHSLARHNSETIISVSHRHSCLDSRLSSAQHWPTPELWALRHKERQNLRPILTESLGSREIDFRLFCIAIANHFLDFSLYCWAKHLLNRSREVQRLPFYCHKA